MGTGLDGTNGDEIDTIVEILTMVILAAVGVFLIYRMCLRMEERTKVYVKTDKVEIAEYTEENSDYEDLFKYTPWQAYMFFGVMKQYDHQPLAITESKTTVEFKEANQGYKDDAAHKYAVLDPLSTGLNAFEITKQNFTHKLADSLNKTSYRLNFTDRHKNSTREHGTTDYNYYGTYEYTRDGTPLFYGQRVNYYQWVLEGE